MVCPTFTKSEYMLLKTKQALDGIFRVSGGAEAILHSVNRVLSEYHNDGSLAMLTPDFSNAFNLVDKSALLHEIKDSCKLLLYAWYLDDGIVIGDSEEVARVLDIIKVSGSGLGLELNIKKTKIFWPSCNGMKLREGLFLVDIRRLSSGVKLLGGAVSRDKNFISGLAMRRVVHAVDLMSLLPQLHDPRSALLLLRSCMGIFKLFFGLGTCQPVHMEEATLFFDKGFSTCYPYRRAWSNTSPVEYRTILKYRLMIPLFPVDAICLVCHKACLDSFGEHAVHCKELPGFKYRHDMVRDVLFDICRRVGISAKKEAPVNFSTDPLDGRSTLRPVNVLVFGWVGWKHACVDLTGVSPLVGLSSKGFTAGQAALKAASCKVTKHDKTCIENQHVFISFAFNTFGFLAPEAVELLSRVQRVMHSNVMTPRSTDVGFKRIGFAIKKELAAQLVAHLPSTTM
ncbi:hypothetical protein Tco_0917898 [Tanacetum coccineum]